MSVRDLSVKDSPRAGSSVSTHRDVECGESSSPRCRQRTKGPDGDPEHPTLVGEHGTGSGRESAPGRVRPPRRDRQGKVVHPGSGRIEKPGPL